MAKPREMPDTPDAISRRLDALAARRKALRRAGVVDPYLTLDPLASIGTLVAYQERSAKKTRSGSYCYTPGRARPEARQPSPSQQSHSLDRRTRAAHGRRRPKGRPVKRVHTFPNIASSKLTAKARTSHPVHQVRRCILDRSLIGDDEQSQLCSTATDVESVEGGRVTCVR